MCKYLCDILIRNHLGKYPGMVDVGHMVDLILFFLRDLHTDFHSNYNSLYSY